MVGGSSYYISGNQTSSGPIHLSEFRMKIESDKTASRVAFLTRVRSPDFQEHVLVPVKNVTRNVTLI